MASEFLAGLRDLLVALDAKRADLMKAVQEVEADIAAIERAARVAEKHGVAAGAVPSRTRPSPTLEAAVVAVPEVPEAKPEVPLPDDWLSSIGRTRRACATLGEQWNPERPRKVDNRRRTLQAAEIPKGGPALDEIYERTGRVAASAAELPPGPGGRRHMSGKAIMSGDPLTPDLKNVLIAADRPLTTAECTAAILQKRGLRLEGPAFTAVANKVAARLADLAYRKLVRRLRFEGSKVLSWERVEPSDDKGTDIHRMFGLQRASTQPNGSTG